MQRILEKVLVAGLFLVPFIPFVVTGSLFFPFITGKAFIFRIIVGILLALWFALVLIDKSYLPHRSPLVLSILVFFSIVTLADIFGVNFQRSLWSNFERMDGLVTFLYLCAYFFVAFSVLTKKNFWVKFWNTSIVASAGVGLYAMLQLVGVLAMSQGGDRVDATLGNSIYLAVYMLFHIFVTLWFLYKKYSSRPLSIFYVLALVLQFVTLYYTGTRGTLLGLVGGLFLTAILIAWKGKDVARLRKISIGFIILMVLGAGMFFGIRKSSFVQNSQFLSRIANTSLSGQTVQSRLVLWGSIAKNGFLERPILGWGQDNFIVVFGKYYDPRMYIQEPWFDRAHSVFFDWLISAGILGLLSYLSLFVISLIVLWRPTTQLSVPERALFTGLLAGYFVHNVFVFDNLISYIFFFSFIGFIESFSSAYHQVVVEKNSNTFLIQNASIRRGTSYVGVVAILILAYTTSIPHIIASQSLITGLTYIGGGQDPVATLPFFERALKDSIGKDESRLQLSRVAFTLASSNASNDIKQAYLSRAYDEARMAVQEDPLNTRPKYFMAIFEARLGNFDEAIRLFEELLALNPNRQMFLSEYGMVLLLQGESEQARKVFERLVVLAPESQEYATRYLALLFNMKMVSEVDAFAQKTFGTTTAHLISEEYRRGEMTDFDSVVEGIVFQLLRGELLTSGNIDNYLSKINELTDAGNTQKALQLVDDAASINTEFAKGVPILREAIQGGKDAQPQNVAQ
ncbi:MAG: O-antigen ligase family protein [Candidatus Campbellbacteria bacterium]|nr:O-antigen ligase family protein [Candidatus Campbellbacteria bacterium]